jgi:decaprenylphospho-beta-D-ribofuranose 2-oxidase
MVLQATALQDIDATSNVGGDRRAGTSLDEMRWLITRLLLVTPGRGSSPWAAIASDIHGKGHHVDGTFGNHVHSFRLLTGRKEVIDVDRKQRRHVLGHHRRHGADGRGPRRPLISSAKPDSSRRRGTVCGLDAMFVAMEEGDSAYRYSVADRLWRPGQASGPRHPRTGIALLDEIPKTKGRRAHSRPANSPSPPAMPSGLVNSWTVGAFNELWYHKSRISHRGSIQDIGLFFHRSTSSTSGTSSTGAGSCSTSSWFLRPREHRPRDRGDQQREASVVSRRVETLRGR